MRKLIALALLLSATLCVMAQNQNSFVVADKNGNSQLVQSLIFQQKQDANRFSWKTESEADGYKQGRDIKDLLFIARANMEFSTANVDEVTEMLENLSGTNQADPQAIASVLDNNENVDFSYSSYDTQSLIVKYKDDNVVSVYPINMINDPFDDETEDVNSLKRFNAVREAIKVPQYRETGTRGKVAVFNYFSNQLTRKTQNKMLEFMMQDLNDHDYGVEYYPYEKMTVKNLKHVIDYSSNYTAVIVISHGFAYEENSYFVIGEEYDISNYYDADYSLLIDENASQEENVPFRYRFWNEGIGAFGFDARYDYAVNVNKMQLNANVILYMGSCDAYNKSTKSNLSGTCIGWDGSNTTAQAHVAVLFYNLMRGKTLADALDVKDQQNIYYDITKSQTDTWKEDPMTEAKMKSLLRGQYAFSSNLDPHYLVPVKRYYRNGSSFLIISPVPAKPNLPYDGPQFLKNKNFNFSKLRMENNGNTDAVDVFPQKIYIRVTPLRLDASPKTYSLKHKENGSYGGLEIDLPNNGAYFVTAAVDEDFTTEILLHKPYVFIKATPFKENGGEWDETENPAEAIDLGLPSGTKWASCNVGATQPEEYGGYYAWGETEEKSWYDWRTYIHCDGTKETCHFLGYDISGTEYDVAHVKWGGNWCMPTLDDIKELLDNCDSEWTSLNGVDGRKFVSKINGNSIFLPADGYRQYGDLENVGSYGYTWSSAQYPDYSAFASFLYFDSDDARRGTGERFNGLSVRPVMHSTPSLTDLTLSTTDPVTVVVDDKATIEITSGNGSYTAESDNEEVAIARVYDNASVIIKGVSVGIATITVTDTKSGQTAKIAVTVTGTINPDVSPAEAIDLGLPSGTKWASCNVGATKPEEYGGYYAWGETEEKDYYYWSTYIHCDGTRETCHDLGSDISGTDYDVAHVKWGGKWCMPTTAEQSELLDNCTTEWTSLNGVNGRKFTSKLNGNSIFLPAAGGRWFGDLDDAGEHGYYWSSTQYHSEHACTLNFGSGSANWRVRMYRGDEGLSVRPVVRN